MTEAARRVESPFGRKQKVNLWKAAAGVMKIEYMRGVSVRFS